jgi:glycosyltransferase involved in cell wall biosynthesis
MHILISCEDMRVGGAQVFVLRLVNVLRKDHLVTLYCLYPDLIDRALVNRYAPDINIEAPRFILDKWIRKLDRLFYILKIDWGIRNIIVAKDIRSVVKMKAVDLVHSNMFKCDYVMAKALYKTNVPFVVTMHGNYEEFLAYYYQEIKGEIIIGYPKKLVFTVNRMNGLVYLTEKNLKIFHSKLGCEDKWNSLTVKKIYNGFAGEISERLQKEKLGIEGDGLVYGFVARGIPEKGWQIVLDAFLLRTNKNDHLILVGWSDYVKDLAERYKHNNIHFVGYANNPLNWIALMDVGALPSTYHESLPNVIAEYLYLGKAVICTDVGDSKNMISCEGDYAGFLLNPNSDDLVNDLAKCFQVYTQQPYLLEAHQKLAKRAFEKFRMEACHSAYLSLYHELINA